ncbi:M64 family metallopeptidase [Malacoplasma muris]|uniref:M64 family metallopeptidase n=1 Tax=Malacoplasma muris TaxID=2119 RepID=UPI00398F130F
MKYKHFIKSILIYTATSMLTLTLGVKYFTQNLQSNNDYSSTHFSSTKQTVVDYADVVPEGKARLIAGNDKISDQDAYVLTIYGDGFMKNQQDKFFEEAKKSADHFLLQSPLDELAPIIKIYAVGVVSNTDVVQGGDKDGINIEDERDTYFHTRYYTNWIERLLTCNPEGQRKLRELEKVFSPHSDQSLVLSNSTKHGGSGGSIAVASLSQGAPNVFVHEFAHSAAGLADEYWEEGYAGEYANKTRESDPEKVPWKRFIGLNGIGVYEFKDQKPTSSSPKHYKPSQVCKMYAHAQPFCEVCKEELRKELSKQANVTMLFFQKYADEIRIGQNGKDMSEYFIFRKGKNEVTGDKIRSGLTLTYYSENGEKLDSAPNTIGKYKVKATFSGNEMFDPCEQIGEYEVLDRKAIIVENKIYDGKPIDIDYSPRVTNYTDINYEYSGKIIYSDTLTEEYNSAEPPILPGEYTVTAKAMNNGVAVDTQTEKFVIEVKHENIVNNFGRELPYQHSEYKPRKIMFAGEGFSPSEKEMFEELTKQAINTLRTSEPYAEFRNYFNFYYTDTASKASGLGSNSYFNLSKDNDGKIVDSDRAKTLSEFLQKKYLGELMTNMPSSFNPSGTDEYSACIVFVNDPSVKKGLCVKDEKGTRFTIYIPANNDGIKYAAKELVNMITNHDEGYSPNTVEEKNEYIKKFRSSFFYRQPSAYAPFVADGYNKTFAYTGKPIDFTNYFHMYIEGVQVDPNSISNYYQYTYYADKNGEIGEKLSEAPKDVGTYFVSIKLADKNGYSMDVNNPVHNNTEYLMSATALTRFHISNSGDVNDGYNDYINLGVINVPDNLCEHKFGDWHDEIPASCTSKGVKGHKDCSECGKHFTQTGSEILDLNIAPLGHTLEHIAKKEPTNIDSGNLEHYKCDTCGKTFSDKDGITEIKDVIIPPINQTGTPPTHGETTNPPVDNEPITTSKNTSNQLWIMVIPIVIGVIAAGSVGITVYLYKKKKK